ncbi:hypothetical protein Lalb_Chr09g0321861 [Lupinus albus]|uniref:Uncharacterized protein n=1 Tax=Lupinus albus TaxID=3870 RepID=A0A6A4PYJ8_LUPAL|nr:hypothetical protein Lalb_Chr09g0321861 [Lupinus albus]
MRNSEVSCFSLCLSIMALISVVVCYYVLWLIMVDINTHTNTDHCISRKTICGFLGFFAVMCLICYTIASCFVFIRQLNKLFRPVVSSTHHAQVVPSPSISLQGSGL